MSSYTIDFRGDHGVLFAVYEVDNKGNILSRLYGPHEKQILFHQATDSYVFIGGSRGGGKSEAIIWDSLFRAHLIPGSRHIIFRKTMGELKSSIIDRYKKIPEELRGKHVAESSYERMEFPNGSIVRFASARSEDDTRKLLSGELATLYFDEWQEWEYHTWKLIVGSVRCTIDKDILGRPVHSQVKGGGTPGGAGADDLNHLFGGDIPKSCPLGEDPEAYVESDYRFIKSLITDNPGLRPGTQAGDEYMKKLLSMPRKIRAAWLEGVWSSGWMGQYFDILLKDRLVAPHDWLLYLASRQNWQPIWMSIDWGKVHSSYVSWHTYVELKLASLMKVKVPVTFREYLVSGISEVALAGEACHLTDDREIRRMERVYLSPDCFGDSLSRAHRMGDVFSTFHLPRPVPAFNKRVEGWTLLYGLLDKAYPLAEPWPGLADGICDGWLIDSECELAPSALAWAMVSKKAGKDGDIDDEGDSPMLDILDGLRYGIASHISPEEQPPQDVRLKERLDQLPVEGSARYIAWLKAKKEFREENSPFYVGREAVPMKKHWGPRRH